MSTIEDVYNNQWDHNKHNTWPQYSINIFQSTSSNLDQKIW